MIVLYFNQAKKHAVTCTKTPPEIMISNSLDYDCL